ncbi:hypothetical protein [Stygiobacter electus]|uniref:Uncharacterized protein n=1 Tax=Stygiobacter electus TaxID=3032292 RepID=A0AAE3TEV9_9BACT|nr:hypothetical protein [Stygiobacter electus]MDF1612693.1 hypothetical protein [Stygiobacter electus]
MKNILSIIVFFISLIPAVAFSQNTHNIFKISREINKYKPCFDKSFYFPSSFTNIPVTTFNKILARDINYCDSDSLTRLDSLGQRKASIILTVSKKIGLGVLMGGLFSLPGGLVGIAINREKGLGELGPGLVGMYTGYLIGSSLGVYLIAKTEKPEVSFWGTLTSGLIGGAISIGIFQVSNQKGIVTLAPFILPLLTSIIYTELID